MDVVITALAAPEALALLPQLSQLLQDAVDSGASVGFMPPLPLAEADRFWRETAGEVQAGHRLLLVAQAPATHSVLGSVQVALATRPNSPHRAEIAKLMVHRRARRQGLARQLMLAAEAQARQLGRTTLVLDTRHGDVAERLYQSLGFQFVGLIPEYFVNFDGKRHATAVYYKLLGTK